MPFDCLFCGNQNDGHSLFQLHTAAPKQWSTKTALLITMVPSPLHVCSSCLLRYHASAYQWGEGKLVPRGIKNNSNNNNGNNKSKYNGENNNNR